MTIVDARGPQASDHGSLGLIPSGKPNLISFSAAVFFVPRERTSPRTKRHSRPNATRGAPVETGFRVLSSRTLFQTESRQKAEDVCKSRDVNPKLEGIEYGKPVTLHGL